MIYFTRQAFPYKILRTAPCCGEIQRVRVAMSIHTLEAHPDGWLYIKEVRISDQNPVKCISWWPTGWRVHEFTHQYGADDLGKPVHVPIRAFPFRYQTEQGLVIHLKDGPQTTTTYFEQEAIPCPPLKGKQKGLPTRWVGYWQIQTRKGWHAL